MSRNTQPAIPSPAITPWTERREIGPCTLYLLLQGAGRMLVVQRPTHGRNRRPPGRSRLSAPAGAPVGVRSDRLCSGQPRRSERPDRASGLEQTTRDSARGMTQHDRPAPHGPKTLGANCWAISGATRARPRYSCLLKFGRRRAVVRHCPLCRGTARGSPRFPRGHSGRLRRRSASQAGLGLRRWRPTS